MTTESLLDFATTAAMLGLSVLASVLAATMQRSRASWFLLGYFICMALDTAISLLVAGWRFALPAPAVRWLHVFNLPVAYLYGLLLYGYVVALTSARHRFHPRELWHLLPAGGVLLFCVANAIAGLDTTPAGAWTLRVAYHAWVLSGLAYLVFAMQHIYRSRHVLERSIADESALRLTWLRALTTLLAGSWIWMSVDRLATAFGRPAQGWPVVLLDGVSFATLFVLAWFGLRQPVLARGEPDGRDVSTDRAEATPYARSALDTAQCAEIAGELVLLMDRDRLYADHRLDLSMLSQRSGWPPNYVSQALNQGRGQNFFEFVNGFRVAAAEHHLADPGDQRTILDIALACGFGSKSTFNAVFKRLTGHTPTSYRRTWREGHGEAAV